MKDATTKEVTTFLWEDIICRHGCPKEIISDRGPQFNNKIMEKLAEKTGIKHKLSAPYRPQTNGLVERFNKTLCEGLAKLGGEENWDEYIASVLFAYRNKRNKSTNLKPFYVVHGRNARLPEDKDQNRVTLMQRVKELLNITSETNRKVRFNVTKAQKYQKEYHDKQGKRKEKFQIGDKVLLYKAYKDKQWSGKLEEKWKGPYYIHEVLLNGSYKIKELNGKIRKIPVNGELLKKYYDRDNFEPMVIV